MDATDIVGAGKRIYAVVPFQRRSLQGIAFVFANSQLSKSQFFLSFSKSDRATGYLVNQVTLTAENGLEIGSLEPPMAKADDYAFLSALRGNHVTGVTVSSEAPKADDPETDDEPSLWQVHRHKISISDGYDLTITELSYKPLICAEDQVAPLLYLEAIEGDLFWPCVSARNLLEDHVDIGLLVHSGASLDELCNAFSRALGERAPTIEFQNAARRCFENQRAATDIRATRSGKTILDWRPL